MALNKERKALVTYAEDRPDRSHFEAMLMKNVQLLSRTYWSKAPTAWFYRIQFCINRKGRDWRSAIPFCRNVMVQPDTAITAAYRFVKRQGRPGPDISRTSDVVRTDRRRLFSSQRPWTSTLGSLPGQLIH
jgi:hypothetical protein